MPHQVESNVTLQNENQPLQRTSPANEDRNNESDSEALPLEADGFDWTENAVNLNELSDGMAALSIRPEGAGYLGTHEACAFIFTDLLTYNP